MAWASDAPPFLFRIAAHSFRVVPVVKTVNVVCYPLFLFDVAGFLLLYQSLDFFTGR
jgi:hypothetical protein